MVGDTAFLQTVHDGFQPIHFVKLGVILAVEDLQTECHGLQRELGDLHQICPACLGDGALALCQFGHILGQVHGVIGDPLHIGNHQQKLGQPGTFRGVQTVRPQGDQRLGDVVIQVVHRIFQIQNLLHLGGILLEEAVHGGLQALQGKLAHAGNFQLGIGQCHSRGNIGKLIDIHQPLMLGFPGLLGQHGDQHLGQFYKQICEGELHDHSGEGEDGVGVGDLTADIPGGQLLDQYQNLGNQGDERAQQDGADGVEQQIQNGGALAVAVGSQRSQQVGRDGADRRADDQIHRGGEAQNSLYGEGLENDCGGGGALQQSGEGNAEENGCHGIFQPAQQGDELLGLGQGSDGLLHGTDPHKEHTEAHDDGADIPHQILLQEQVHGSAREENHGCVGAEVKSGQLGGDGGTDIGTHDDADGLRQGHKRGVDEADDHHIGGRGALDHQRDRKAHQHGHEPVAGRLFQNDPQLVACGVAKAGGHERHAVQEQTYASQQGENIQ